MMTTNLMDRRSRTKKATSLMEKRSTQGVPSRIFPMLLALFCLFLAAPAYAQGLASVNSLLDQVLGVLQAASIAIVTIAIIWAGYKFLFRNADVGEVAKIILAGILIGGAAEIAALILG